MSEIIDGKVIAAKIREEIKEKVAAMDVKPGLAVIRVGEDPASKVYVNMKEKACKEIGMYSEKHVLPEDITEEELLVIINKLNKSKKIHGFLVQLPLPAHIDEQKVLEAINPEKDADGFHPINVGRMFTGIESLVPATPSGIIKLIESTGIEISGKNAVVIGRSNIVGKPVAILLLQKHATVTVCHSRTKDLVEECKRADILVAAVGKARMITSDMVKEGSVVIDVGVNRVDDDSEKGYHLEGDVDFDNVKDKVGFVTPVPGGVGPMTIAMLLSNCLKAKEMQENS
jgi:methylenetetrahydrofolate dehydrogenase (NADP+) / methenyltetrahydrofolate cyclohydrolase